MANHIMSTYKRLPIQFQRGEGIWLWDSENKQYLDALSGIAVCGLGHAHPAIAQAIANQAGLLVHTSNLYGITLQEQLADGLCELSGMDRVFFCNSGAEANEAAIKIARLYGHNRGIHSPTIIVMEKSFHGRTLATLTATGNRKVQAGFEPLVQGFIRVPYNDLAAIQTVAANSNDVVAVLVEPIQGEGGINIPDADYLQGIRSLCNENHWLMMLDEIQSGMGRTGKWFAWQHSDVTPDVATLAKALGNGVPIGACLARGKAAEMMKPGSHGSTFGGNPLACRAAITVLEVLEQQHLVAHAATLGEYFLAGFHAALSGQKGVTSIRGRGLMIGIELDRPCAELVEKALEQGLLINVTAERVIRLLPPLVTTVKQADIIIEHVSELVREFLAG
ncbi:MAG: aspartate aminotransferase family protein [Gammaproteobacteria bacterium]|jgi:acetylornithine aminotransferase|nr:aspartate aminotransferase family protein [Gammaproteobacteria bacterium]